MEGEVRREAEGAAPVTNGSSLSSTARILDLSLLRGPLVDSTNLEGSLSQYQLVESSGREGTLSQHQLVESAGREGSLSQHQLVESAGREGSLSQHLLVESAGREGSLSQHQLVESAAGNGSLSQHPLMESTGRERSLSEYPVLESASGEGSLSQNPLVESAGLRGSLSQHPLVESTEKGRSLSQNSMVASKGQEGSLLLHSLTGSTGREVSQSQSWLDGESSSLSRRLEPLGVEWTSAAVSKSTNGHSQWLPLPEDPENSPVKRPADPLPRAMVGDTRQDRPSLQRPTSATTVELSYDLSEGSLSLSQHPLADTADFSMAQSATSHHHQNEASLEEHVSMSVRDRVMAIEKAVQDQDGDLSVALPPPANSVSKNEQNSLLSQHALQESTSQEQSALVTHMSTMSVRGAAEAGRQHSVHASQLSSGVDQSIRFQPSMQCISISDSYLEKRPISSSTPSSSKMLSQLSIGCTSMLSQEKEHFIDSVCQPRPPVEGISGPPGSEVNPRNTMGGPPLQDNRKLSSGSTLYIQDKVQERSSPGPILKEDDKSSSASARASHSEQFQRKDTLSDVEVKRVGSESGSRDNSITFSGGSHLTHSVEKSDISGSVLQRSEVEKVFGVGVEGVPTLIDRLAINHMAASREHVSTAGDQSRERHLDVTSRSCGSIPASASASEKKISDKHGEGALQSNSLLRSPSKEMSERESLQAERLALGGFEHATGMVLTESKQKEDERVQIQKVCDPLGKVCVTVGKSSSSLEESSQTSGSGLSGSQRSVVRQVPGPPAGVPVVGESLTPDGAPLVATDEAEADRGAQSEEQANSTWSQSVEELNTSLAQPQTQGSAVPDHHPRREEGEEELTASRPATVGSGRVEEEEDDRLSVSSTLTERVAALLAKPLVKEGLTHIVDTGSEDSRPASSASVHTLKDFEWERPVDAVQVPHESRRNTESPHSMTSGRLEAHPVLPASETRHRNMESPHSMTSGHLEAHPVLPASETRHRNTESPHSMTSGRLEAHPVPPASETRHRNAESPHSMTSGRLETYPVPPISETCQRNTASPHSMTNGHLEVHPVLPASETHQRNTESSHSMSTGRLETYPVPPVSETRPRNTESPQSMFSECSSTSYQDLPTSLHPSMVASRPKVAAIAETSFEGPPPLTGSNHDDQMDPDMKKILMKYGEILSEDEHQEMVINNSGSTAGGRLTPTGSVAESDDTGLTQRVSRLLQVNPDLQRSYLDEDPAHSMTIALASGSTTRTATPPPTLSRESLEKGPLNTELTAKQGSSQGSPQTHPNDTHLGLPSSAATDNLLAGHVQGLLQVSLLPAMAPPVARAPNSSRSSRTDSLDYDVLQSDLEEIQRGLAILQTGELSLEQVDTLGGCGGTGGVSGGGAAGGMGSRRMSDASEDTTSKITESEVGTPRKFSWDYGDLKGEDFRFVTSRSDLQPNSHVAGAGGSQTLEEQEAAARGEPEGMRSKSPSGGLAGPSSSSSSSSRAQVCPSSAPGHIEGKYTRIARELEKETSPQRRLPPRLHTTTSSSSSRRRYDLLGRSYDSLTHSLMDTTTPLVGGEPGLNDSSHSGASLSQQVYDLMVRESPPRQAYQYLAEAEDSLRKARSHPRVYASEGHLHTATTSTTPSPAPHSDSLSDSGTFRLTPIPPRSFHAFGNVQSFLTTQLNKMSSCDFDVSIELRSPLKRHLEGRIIATGSSPDLRSDPEVTERLYSSVATKHEESQRVASGRSSSGGDRAMGAGERAARLLADYQPEPRPVTMQDYVDGTYKGALAEKVREREHRRERQRGQEQEKEREHNRKYRREKEKEQEEQRKLHESKSYHRDRVSSDFHSNRNESEQVVDDQMTPRSNSPGFAGSMASPCSSERQPARLISPIRSPDRRRSSPSSGSSSGLRPYRPPGSQELYYVESSADDGNVSVANSETTLESTHLGSDDAKPPHFPNHWLGSRLDPLLPATNAIYSKDKTTGALALDPIVENKSFEESRYMDQNTSHDQTFVEVGYEGQNRSHHNNTDQPDASEASSDRSNPSESQGQPVDTPGQSRVRGESMQAHRQALEGILQRELAERRGERVPTVPGAVGYRRPGSLTDGYVSHHYWTEGRSTEFGTPQKHRPGEHWNRESLPSTIGRSTEPPGSATLEEEYTSSSSYQPTPARAREEEEVDLTLEGDTTQQDLEENQEDDITARLRLYPGEEVHTMEETLEESKDVDDSTSYHRETDAEVEEALRSRDYYRDLPEAHPARRYVSPPPMTAPTPPRARHLSPGRSPLPIAHGSIPTPTLPRSPSSSSPPLVTRGSSRTQSPPAIIARGASPPATTVHMASQPAIIARGASPPASSVREASPPAIIARGASPSPSDRPVSPSVRHHREHAPHWSPPSLPLPRSSTDHHQDLLQAPPRHVPRRARSHADTHLLPASFSSSTHTAPAGRASLEQLTQQLEPLERARENTPDINALWEKFQLRSSSETQRASTLRYSDDVDMNKLSSLLQNPVRHLVSEVAGCPSRRSTDASSPGRGSRGEKDERVAPQLRSSSQGVQRPAPQPEVNNIGGGHHLAETLTSGLGGQPTPRTREDVMLQSIPENTTLDSVPSSTDMMTAEMRPSLHLLPDDPKLLKLQTRILRQRQKYEREKQREQRRREKILKLERMLAAKGHQPQPQPASEGAGREAMYAANYSQTDEDTTPTSIDTYRGGKSTSTPSTDRRWSSQGGGRSSSEETSPTVSDITTVSALTSVPLQTSDESTTTLVEEDSSIKLTTSATDTLTETTPQTSETEAVRVCACCHKKKSRPRARSPQKGSSRSKSPHKISSSNRPRSGSPSKVTKPSRKERPLSPVSSKRQHARSPSPETKKHRRDQQQQQQLSERRSGKGQRENKRAEDHYYEYEGEDSHHHRHRREEAGSSVGKNKPRHRPHHQNQYREEPSTPATPSQRTVGVNVPTPISLSPPRRSQAKDVTMVSEAVQTTPNLHQQRGRRQAERAVQHGAFTPESTTPSSECEENEQPIRAEQKKTRVRAGQAGLAWYVPLKEGRPWRQPLRERQAHALSLDTWAPENGEAWRRSYDVGSHRPTTTTTTSSSSDVELYLSRTGRPQAGQTETSLQPQLSLQEALELKRQDFISQSRERLKHLALRTQERQMQELHSRHREQLFQVHRKLDPNKNAHPYSENLFNPKKRAMTKKEMKELTNKKYATLEEVKRKEQHAKREEEYRTYRTRAQIYKKKILSRVLNKKAAWVN